MRGYVHTINRRRGLVAISTDRGFTIIELLGNDPIHLGDRLEWDEDIALGNATYRNLTKGTATQVNVHAHAVHGSRVRQRLKL
jgi:hypothetical protein